MLILLSPAKRLAGDIRLASRKRTEPRLKQHSEIVMNSLRKLSKAKLKRLMKISNDTAALNYQRHQDLQIDPEPTQTSAAVAAFRGDAYLGLRAEDWDAKSLAWAQQHLRILSGLYGLLRPLDNIQPYRLEMGSALNIVRNTKLKSYWRAHLNALLAEDVQASAADKQRPLILNLASVEYGSVLCAEAMPSETRIIKVLFLKPQADGTLRSPGFAVKRSRGAMANFIIGNRITTESDAQSFADDGYRFESELSSTDEWTFVARP